MRTHIDRVTGLRALPELEGAIKDFRGFQATLYLENLGANLFYLNMFAIDPKRFWTGPSCFGLVQTISDMFNRFGQLQKWLFLVLIFFHFTHVQNVLNESKMIMIGPKQFGSVQNCFGPIKEQEKLL